MRVKAGVERGVLQGRVRVWRMSLVFLVLGALLGGSWLAISLDSQAVPLPGESGSEYRRIYSAPDAPETTMPDKTPVMGGASGSQSLVVTADPTVKQGEVLRVKASVYHPGLSVVIGERTIPFFAQPDGTALALVSVSAYEKPGGYTLRIRDAQGQFRQTQPLEVLDGRYQTQNIRVSKSSAGLQPLPGEMEAIQRLLNTVTPVRYWEEPFVSPTPDCENSPFGVKRLHNGKHTGNYHRGVDLRSPTGRPIKATAAGKVQIATMYRLHGGTVGIDHGQGVGSIYIHMSKLAVKPGQQVKQGEIIGQVGSTGFATGPHLHWGLYVSGQPVNPNQWVKGVPRCGS